LKYRGLRSAIEFEWIGLEGSLEETADPRRECGVTSADALMVAVTQRRRRGYLFEWKLGESYKAGLYKGDGGRGQDRWRRYTPLYQAADSSFNGAILVNGIRKGNTIGFKKGFSRTLGEHPPISCTGPSPSTASFRPCRTSAA